LCPIPQPSCQQQPSHDTNSSVFFMVFQHMLAPPPAPYTHLPPHSNSTPAPSHQYQANHQPIGWVHDPILRDNYGAATQVPITDANAQQNLPAEARILFGK
jgi:hypothetical protein